MNLDYDAIVIGAGVAGLSVGALLAHYGHPVLVLEKNNFIGGRCHYIEKDGFTVDYGVHLNRFGTQGRCAEVLRCIGKKPEFVYPGRPFVYYEKDFQPFPHTPVDFFKIFFSTKFLSKKTKLNFLKIFLSAPFTNPKKFLKSSLYQFLSRYNPTDEVLDIATLFCGVAFICPDLTKVSAVEVGEFLRKAIFTRKYTSYLKGGWKGLINSLKERIEENGKILTNCEVKKIVVEKNKVLEILTNKGAFQSKSYICTIPFSQISQIIDLKALSSDLQEYAKNVEPSSGITLDFGLRKKVSEIDGIIMTVEPLTIGCFISNIEPSLAPEGKQLGTWYYHIPVDKIGDRKYSQKQIQVLKDLLQEMFPDIWDNLLWERVMILDIVDGAVPKVGQTVQERPKFKSNVNNLFFAGDTTGGWGWGSEIAFDSAIRCSKLVRRFLKDFLR